MLTSDKILFYCPVRYLAITWMITYDNFFKYYREQSFLFEIPTGVTSVTLMISSDNFL